MVLPIHCIVWPVGDWHSPESCCDHGWNVCTFPSELRRRCLTVPIQRHVELNSEKEKIPSHPETTFIKIIDELISLGLFSLSARLDESDKDRISFPSEIVLPDFLLPALEEVDKVKKVIPPQPLRPAPNLVTFSSVDERRQVNERAPETDEAGTKGVEGETSVNEIDVIASRRERHRDGIGMTNPFLPFLQASSQFFSQTLQGLQSLQNAEADARGLGQDPQIMDGQVEQTPTTLPVGKPGQTMGELLFSSLPQPGFGGSGDSGGFLDTDNKEGNHSGKPNPFTYDDKTEESSGCQRRNATDSNVIVNSSENAENIGKLPQRPSVNRVGNVMPPSSLALHDASQRESSSSVDPERVKCVDGSSWGNGTITEDVRQDTVGLVGVTNQQILADTDRDEVNRASIKETVYEGIKYNHNSREFSLNGTTLDLKSQMSLIDTSKASTESCRQTLRNINSYISASFSGTQQPTPNFALLRNVRSFSLRQASTDSVGSDGSDAGSPDGSSSLPSLQRAMSCDSVSSDTSVSLEQEPPQLTGHLCVSLEYDSEAADLLVTVVEAKQINGLHPDPCLPFDSYVRVYLLPDKSTNMQTRVYRKSLNPIYKEKFMFGIEPNELPIRSLVFYMYATDKYSNTLIGETELKLRDVHVHQLPVSLWLPLTDTGQRGAEHGEIMFSLSYLPTAERLTVVVVKARNLKFPRENAVGDPFVKVYLLQRGKKVSKKKSSTKRAEKNPIFNEAMIFSVPAHALQTIQLRITVADSAELEGNRALSIGHVLVGSMSTGKPLSHWNQMLSSLRKPIAMWHLLRK